MKHLLFIFLFVALSLSYLFEVDKLLVKHFTFFSNLKSMYVEKYIEASEFFKKHLEHEKKIKELEIQNLELKEYKILYNTVETQLNTLKEFLIHVEIPEVKPQIELVKVLSYVDFNDFTRVWLDKTPQDEKILGLISENFAAGIAVNRNGKSVGLLNGNKDCTYAVFVGEGRSPGIVTTAGAGTDELKVKFIPIWSDINIGDEVITSGMDNIFFEGLKVGKVLEVSEQANMKVATIKPYVNALKKKYFYIYNDNYQQEQLIMQSHEKIQ
ncbi:rod shape-determining protein MreC [Aliarcobacter butzleri]|uniref:rod shape-determining protein MreC n=1 Tax=Aliarcobacter butzleri TaxID=28197 RepID=UPI00215A3ADA|nr:rod shape-determining protein MreC [Aliarcobacter butzleri]MCR8710848.1 rod shape-determining protein MreC [Aliarcobacter butzleri]